jgi:hypothetical protein
MLRVTASPRVESDQVAFAESGFRIGEAGIQFCKVEDGREAPSGRRERFDTYCLPAILIRNESLKWMLILQ